MRFLKTNWFSLILAGFLILITIAACSPKKETIDFRGRTAYVFAFDYDTDEVFTHDFSGNIWVFEGIEDWQIGDIATFVLDGKGTETIDDDEIISVRYSGYLNEDTKLGGQNLD